MMQMDAPIPIAAAPEAFLKYQDMSCFVGFKQSAILYRTATVQGFCYVRYGTVFSDFEFKIHPCTVTVNS